MLHQEFVHLVGPLQECVDTGEGLQGRSHGHGHVTVPSSWILVTSHEYHPSA